MGRFDGDRRARTRARDRLSAGGTISGLEEPTLDPDATARTGDTLGQAIDGALAWDHIEEHRALARVEQGLFARNREPLRISRYLLLRALGSGGTGIVYDGYDPELARRVAVKVLRAGRRDAAEVERARARFVREAKSIAQLSHANVIGVYDVGTYGADEVAGISTEKHGAVSGEGVFIVMELVEGSDLASWLERGKRSWREVVKVFLAAGQGLAAAHRAGIVHRDFKPGNVLVGDDGRVKVVDFGLALTYGGTATNSGDTLTPVPSGLTGSESIEPEDSIGLNKLTRTGVVLGTPAYMAPEQHRGEAADQKADQFAFCASLYRALYGQHAFEGRGMDSLFVSKARGKVRTPPEVATVPAWVHRVILRGLAADPQHRFADMAALLRALQADPVRRVLRWARWALIPLALVALGYAGWLATRPGEVRVTVASKGAPVGGTRVFVGDKELAGGRGQVPAGVYRLRVTAPDHEPQERVVEVARGGTHQVVVELEHEQGRFELELEPAGGHVFVDGVDYGARLHALPVDTGTHEILLRHQGYVDQRLQWTVGAGETRSGFVALRKAMVWGRDASGVYRQSDWIGDADGDGLDDLIHRRFTVLTVYDPWDDAELWRIELGATSFYRLCDVDGDGVRDVVTLRDGPVDRELAVFSGASKVRRPESLWATRSPRSGDAWREVACLEQPDGGHDLIVVGAVEGKVVRVNGRTGEQQWTLDPGGLPLHALVLGATADAPTRVAIVSHDGVEAVRADDGSPVWSNALTVTPLSTEGEPRAAWIRAIRDQHERRGAWAAAVPLDAQAGDDVLLHVQVEGVLGLVALGGGDGAEHWRIGRGESLPLSNDATLGDVDRDGSQDLLVRDDYDVLIVSGRTGTTRWRKAADDTGIRLFAQLPTPAVSLRDDEGLELLDATTGRTMARADLRTPGGAVGVADWDGDSELDVLVGGRDGVLYVFDRRLNPMATMPMEVPIEKIEASRDANHDGFSDLLLQARGPAVITGPKICWERSPAEAIRAAPTIHDFDGDGELELALFGQFAKVGGLNILDARTGQVELTPSSAKMPVIIRPPALLEGASGPQLLSLSGLLRRFDTSTTRVVAHYSSHNGYASPTLADVDGDGDDEVVMVTWENPGEVHVLDPQTFEVQWVREIGALGSFGAPHVSDVDGDGAAEVVVATLDGEVVALSNEGEPKWRVPTGGRLNFEPTVADLDGDGWMEVAVTPHSKDLPLVVLDGRSGEVKAHWQDVASRRARPLAYDIEGDGRSELLVSTASRGLIALDHTGSMVWEYGFVDGGGLQPSASGSPTLADLEGDGSPELIAGFDDGSVHTVDATTGAFVWRFQVGREEVEASPAVADVDGDGHLEVFVSGLERRLLCLEHRPVPRPAVPGRAIGR